MIDVANDSRLAGTPPERRYLTIMFIDLVGYTQLSERLDPEDLSALLSRYQQLALAVMKRFGGFVASFSGDGVLVYFGYPTAHGNDAERALRAALEMIERLNGLDLPLSNETARRLEARIGVHTGLVIIGPEVMSFGPNPHGVVGEVPNLAARLQSEAPRNGIVVSRETRGLVEDLFDFAPLGARMLKGLSRPIEAFQVIRARPPADYERARRRRNFTTMVGRGVRDLRVAWEDGERVFCRGWRADGEGGHGAVLAVLPDAERPLPASLHRLAHEYELTDELDAAWAARPLALVSEGGLTMLMLEDPGGEPLERLIDGPMEVERFLRLSVGVAAALGKAHQRGLVHKDVKPANILVNCSDGLTRLTGFGIATRLPRERQAPEPPEVVAGTLAYMAPEQTGRMNRSIDSRSDLYALGVAFYQMLTGRLPFSAADPMEWVHCHIARQPVAPSERLESVPAVISEIVMKLLAKTAEERYQTAAGVEHDLRRCLAEWERHGRIASFALGERDRPDRLMIPQKLYGREREVEALLATFDRVVASGAPELVLVSGYSGVGKSSVVHELHRALVPQRGLFASGKFDQLKRDIPIRPWCRLFRAWCALCSARATRSWRVGGSHFWRRWARTAGSWST